MRAMITTKPLLILSSVLFLMIVTMFLLPKALFADFRFNLADSNLSLTPFIALEEEYNDNIFLSRFVERSDWITTISPGFNLTLFNPRGALTSEELDTGENQLLTLTYAPGFVYFLHNPQYDYTSHTQQLDAAINLSPRFTFGLAETYLRTNESELDEMLDTDVERTSARNNRSKINRITVSPRLEYRFGSESSLASTYRYTNQRSEDPLEDDYIEQNINTALMYWFNNRNGFNFIFNYSRGDFDIETDLLNGYSFTSRFIHIVNMKLSLYAEGSAELYDFEERLIRRGVFRPSTLRDVDDEDIYRATAGFSYSFSPEFMFEAGGGYFWWKGYRADDDGFDLLARLTRTTRKMDFTLEYVKGYGSDFFALRDSGSYKYWTIAAELVYRYTTRLEFSLNGSYDNRDYSAPRTISDTLVTAARGEGRDDDVYKIGFSINYQIFKKVQLEFEYRHDEVDSNFDTEYYIVNRAIGRITVAF